MTTEKAIECLSLLKVFDAPDLNTAVKMAVAALRAQQQTEKNELLTLEELREMDGEPVFVVTLTGSSKERFSPEWCIVSVIGEWGAANIGGVDHDCYAFRDYGTEWLAYRHRPEEADHGQA